MQHYCVELSSQKAELALAEVTGPCGECHKRDFEPEEDISWFCTSGCAACFSGSGMMVV